MIIRFRERYNVYCHWWDCFPPHNGKIEKLCPRVWSLPPHAIQTDCKIKMTATLFAWSSIRKTAFTTATPLVTAEHHTIGEQWTPHRRIALCHTHIFEHKTTSELRANRISCPPFSHKNQKELTHVDGGCQSLIYTYLQPASRLDVFSNGEITPLKIEWESFHWLHTPHHTHQEHLMWIKRSW